MQLAAGSVSTSLSAYATANAPSTPAAVPIALGDGGAQCCGSGSRFAHLHDALQGGAHEHTEGHPHDAR